jgi:Flp pilus assembly protein TadG
MKQESQMTRSLTVKSLAKRFAADQKGTFAIMAGLVAVPMVLAVGAAVDFGRYNATQTQVQAALDAAALTAAAMRNATDAERIKAANASFELNIAQSTASVYKVEKQFKIENKKVVATAEVEVPMAFMQVGGITEVNGASRAEVNILVDKKAEIVMVLDYSGSMTDPVGGKTKYVAMKEAAKKLVTDLSKTDADRVQFGVVPFSHHVYTTLPGSMVVGGTGSAWTGCTQDREYPYNVSAGTPTPVAATKWNQPWAPEHADADCKEYQKRNLKTLDLTKNFSSVTTKLDAMRPYEWTHIALGVEFGYHMLSPNAPFTKGAAFNDKETKKFMLVLTDGMQTEPAFGPGGLRDVASGEANLEKLCESAKADGITIITMAFDLDDTTTRKRLQNCATNPAQDFFVANDAKALATAFESVKNAIAAEVYLSK